MMTSENMLGYIELDVPRKTTPVTAEQYETFWIVMNNLLSIIQEQATTANTKSKKQAREAHIGRLVTVMGLAERNYGHLGKTNN